MPLPKAMLIMGRDAFTTLFGDDELRQLGSLADLGNPVWADELDSDAVRQRLAETEVLITSWGCPPLTAERLAAAPRLRAVLHAAGSVRSFATDALWSRDLLVTNARDANAVSVAEFTLAAIVFAGKKAPFLAADARLHRDDWSYRSGRGPLSNHLRTVGLVGYSRVGRQVVERLRMLETNAVLVSDPYADPVEVAAAGAQLVELDELLRRSDILSLHLPELPTTRGYIGERELALLRDGATVINTARGSVIDTPALERECAAGRLDAILDVTDPEPLPRTSVLYDLPNVMITPHIAGSLDSETKRLSAATLEELRRYTAGEPPLSPVTPDMLKAIA